MTLLRDAVRRMQQTLIVITHDMAVASQSDRVVLIEDGRLSEQSRLPAAPGVNRAAARAQGQSGPDRLGGMASCSH